MSLLLASVAVAGVMLLAGCKNIFKKQELIGGYALSPSIDTTYQYKDIKIGFVFNGFIGDKGWSSAHNEARRQLEAALGVKTDYIGNASDCEGSVEGAIRELISKDCNVIVACSSSFEEDTHKVAKEYPDIKFFCCAGLETAENVSCYFGRKYEANYLCGIVAGLRTKTNKLGAVCAMPIPEAIRLIDAYALGVRLVNKDAKVLVKYTGSWFDPLKEKSNAIELINLGCDIISQNQNSTAAQSATRHARKTGKEIWCIGENIPNYVDSPDCYLTAPIFNFYPYYKKQLNDMIKGTWKSSSYWGGIEDEIISLDSLSPNCAEGTQEIVKREEQRIIDGENHIFDGPIFDNNGILKVNEGKHLSDDELKSISWYVEGIEVLD